jgi:hypothetical protein
LHPEAAVSFCADQNPAFSASSAPYNKVNYVILPFLFYGTQTSKGGRLMLQAHPKTAQTLLSPRIPRDNEHERYHPELEEELKECLFCLRRNAMMFDLEVDSDLIEQRIYERQALLCRYRYLLARARELGLHTILKKYQPLG